MGTVTLNTCVYRVESGRLQWTNKDDLLRRLSCNVDSKMNARIVCIGVLLLLIIVTFVHIVNNNIPYSEVVFSMIIKRRPLYYIITLFLPSFLITQLSLVGLFSPSTVDGRWGHFSRVLLLK
jgi:hypothetical protein